MNAEHLVRFQLLAVMSLMLSALTMAPANPAAAQSSAEATLTVSPTTDLVDKLHLRVSGTGFRPNVTVVAFQCGSQAWSFARCRAVTEAMTDGSGSYNVYGYQIDRYPVFRNGETIDCERRPGRCSVVVAEQGRWRTAVFAPITFDTPPPPTPPPPPPPPPPPLPPADPPADHFGLTWKVKERLPLGYVAVGTDGLTDPYEGDTPPEAVLPILCLFFDGSPYPSWYLSSYGFGEYNAGWARGWVAASPPVSGTQLTSREAADGICASNFGPGWRMAEHHDPWFGDPPVRGQWNMWAAGSIPVGTRLWTAIDDQYANPWD